MKKEVRILGYKEAQKNQEDHIATFKP